MRRNQPSGDEIKRTRIAIIPVCREKEADRVLPVLNEKYHLFPDAEDWKGRILLLESSEEKPSPEKYEQALKYFKERGVFEAVSGVLFGKPMDETYAREYRQLQAIQNAMEEMKKYTLLDLRKGMQK